MDDCRYHYRATVTSVYDADTVTVAVDVGFDIWFRNVKVRLYGIDAPEIRGEERQEGLRARDYLRRLIEGREITLRTIRDRKEKYGRYLGVIHCQGENVNEKLVKEGYAKPWVDT